MKILVVDDHALIRQAMQGVLKKLRRDAVVIEVADGQRAFEAVAAHSDVELILLDLTLPDLDGFFVLSELRERYPNIAIVVLSAVQDPDNVTRALELGAAGYIPKSAQGDVILNALRLVISGGIYVPPEILAREPRVAATTSSDDVMHRLGLTDRQIEVLALLMQGKNNKTICRLLNLAEPTVKNHVTAILKALNVSSRTEAVVAINNLGSKPPPSVKR